MRTAFVFSTFAPTVADLVELRSLAAQLPWAEVVVEQPVWSEDDNQYMPEHWLTTLKELDEYMSERAILYVGLASPYPTNFLTDDDMYRPGIDDVYCHDDIAF